MKIFDPHIHMTSRTTDDYVAMEAAGISVIIEPAFWVGQPRTQVGAFIDYFNSLIGWERFRASQFGIRHFCTIGLNPKEANREGLAEEVLELAEEVALDDGKLETRQANWHRRLKHISTPYRSWFDH